MGGDDTVEIGAAAGGANPLLKASACNESISRLAACRSASLSSAVCRLELE